MRTQRVVTRTREASGIADNPLPRNKSRRQKLDAKSQAIPATRLPQRLANEALPVKQTEAKIASAGKKILRMLNLEIFERLRLGVVLGVFSVFSDFLAEEVDFHER